MEETISRSGAVITPPAGPDDLIQIRGIAKSYGVVKALKGVTFGIGRGEIHTLLGENGAGKSTLVKIIMGEECPDSGELVIDGKPVTSFTPQNAQSLGVAMVHQELALFENMTVAENIFPNAVFRKGPFVDWKELDRRAEESIRVFGMDVKAGQRMDSLTLAQQQMVEILRCISNHQRIILLDEPTSGLDSAEADRLMEVVRGLRDDGITIIYISHRINEIMSLSDRITIMRDGDYICTFENNEDLTEGDLVNKMVGRDFSASLYSKKAYQDASANEVVYEVRGLAKRSALRPVDFQLRRGEVVGFFGLEGAGSNTLSRMLYGLERKEAGEILFHGRALPKITPTALIEEKILYLNNNRKKAGLLLDSPANDNMMLPVLKRLSRATIVQRSASFAHTRKYVEMFSIAIPSVFQKPRNLSGGNQQKLMLSMCLGTQPELLIVNEPTRGIDVGAKSEIHKFLLKTSAQGIGLIVFSAELPELIALCDRIYVMKNQGLAGCLSGDAITERAVMALAAGSGEGGEPNER